MKATPFEIYLIKMTHKTPHFSLFNLETPIKKTVSLACLPNAAIIENELRLHL